MWVLGSGQARLVRGLMLSLFGATASADGPGTPARVDFDQVRLGDGEAALALRTALGRAAQRLAAPACQGLLSEFQDQSGRTLQAVLDQAGRSSVDHMAGLFFYDGSQTSRCKTASTLAFTSAGSRVVQVCPAQFRSQERQDTRQTRQRLTGGRPQQAEPGRLAL